VLRAAGETETTQENIARLASAGGRNYKQNKNKLRGF
jgi:hypothetical protein